MTAHPDPARVQRLFDEALAMAPEQRRGFLDRGCGEDAALRAEVEDLLKAHVEAGDFLSSPTAHPSSSDGLPTTGADAPSHDGPTTDLAASATAPTRRSPGEAVGARIGPYKLLQQIGEGGFGSVFMAEQERPVQRRVALKIIKLGMDTRAVIARFEAERQALAMMDHPNIAKVLDAGATDTGRPYFVMELVKGQPITTFCDQGKLSIQERLELFAQVCTAVQHAHTKGIIHRDIKPSNVLVNVQDGRPFSKVIDFGIAKATASKLTEKTLFTEHQQLIGTPEYMSPEQAAGSLDIDTRTDVYSLGVLLYELLTGSTPFSGKELRSAAYDEIQRIIREVDPPAPSTRLSQNTETIAGVAASRQSEPKKLGTIVRGELDWIVMKALEKDRQRRYETANGLAADVRRYLSGEAVVAAPPGAGYRLKKFVRRHRGIVSAGAAVGAALLIGVIGFAWQYGIARSEGAEAVKQRDLAVVAEERAKSEAARATEAETKAVNEAQSAKQIADFLASMLKGVGPKIALGRDATLLREIVDTTADRVDKELADQPAVAARLLEVLATAYNELAVFDKAESLARRCMELIKALPGDNRLNVAKATFGLAIVLESKGKYDEAKALFQESYDEFKAVGAGQTKEGLASLSGIGGVLYRVNDLKGAEPIFREVLEGRRTLYRGTDNDDLASAMERVAIVVSDRHGDMAECESLEREALAMRRRLYGEFHPEVALSLSNLASMMHQARRFDEAIDLSRQSVEQHRKIFGERHPRTAATLTVFAECLEEAGKTTEATEVGRLALEINRESLGPNHRTTLNSVNSIAMLLTRTKDYAGAEEQYRVMLAWGRANYPPGDLRTAAVVMLVARSVTGQGRHADAEPLYREALEARIKNRPEGHAQIAEARNALADCLVAQGRHADAEVLLVAVERDARLPASKPGARSDAARRLAEFYAGWNSADPGKGHDVKAAEWTKEIGPAVAPEGKK